MRKNYWAIKHDKSRTRLYQCWRDMKQRCSNPHCCNYKYYGARGISVCDEWLDFINFYNWAIANGYSDTLTIDRIDNDGNYEPDNCRWASKSVQNMSMRHKNTSGYIGICKHSLDDSWYGRVKVDGKCFYTGRSKDIHEAARMRNEYIEKHNLPNVKNIINGKT